MSRKSKAAEFVDERYNIQVFGHNVLVTDAMKDYAIEKVSKIERFSDRIIDIVVTMDIQRIDHKVDIVMKVDHVKIRSSAVSENMYASIDVATEKLQRQLLKYKNRIQEHTGRSLSAIDMRVMTINAQKDLDVINDEIESETRRKLIEDYQSHQVVCKETLPLKMLTIDEAVMKMDLSNDHFLIYRSEEDQKLKVIYRRKDENYGIIEVEN